MYWGVMGSRSSVAVGRPRSSTSRRKCRAVRSPFSRLQVSLRSGSMINPFQPTVVRGFSKYTRMATRILSLILTERSASFAAYSRPAWVSWIEHGPTMTRRRSSSPRSVRAIWLRDSRMKPACSPVLGISCRRVSGVGRGLFWEMRMSDVFCTGCWLIAFSSLLSSLKRHAGFPGSLRFKNYGYSTQ